MKDDTDALLAERKKTHGEYAHHAGVTQALKRAMRNSPNWETLPDIMKETLDMNAHKIGRVLTGNPFTADHFVDMIGYDRLVQQRTDANGLLPEYADIAAIYGAVPGYVPAGTEESCLNAVAATLTMDIEQLAGSKEYKDFYHAVASTTGVSRAEAKQACLELGYGKDGKKMRMRVRD